MQRLLDCGCAEREERGHGISKGGERWQEGLGIKPYIAVSTANVTDRKAALAALERCQPGLSRVQSLLCDSGYMGKSFAQRVQDILGEHIAVEIAKRSELHAFKVIFKVMPRRWIVQRSFAMAGEAP